MNYLNKVYKNYQTIIKKNAHKVIIFNPTLIIKNDPNYHFLKHTKTSKKIKVLDLGAGTGGLTSLLADVNNIMQLDAVEKSSEQIKILKEKCFDCNFNIHQIDIFEFLKKTNDSSYDLIYLIDVLEHFDMDNVFKLIGEINRILTSDGKFVCRVPNMISPFSSIFSYGDITHLSHFSPDSLSQIILSHSFHKIKIEPDPIISSRPLFGLIRFLFAFVVSLIIKYSYLLVIGKKVGPYSSNFVLITQKTANRF